MVAQAENSSPSRGNAAKADADGHPAVLSDSNTPSLLPPGRGDNGDGSAEDEGGGVTDVPMAEAAVTVLGQSVAKPRNDYFKVGDGVVWRRNEDRYRFSDTPDGLLATVADGAGSSGMFCGAWAEELVERLPETPITGLEDLNRWIDGFWEDFAAEFKRSASQDAAKLSKFVREGSYATLVACWLSRRDDGLSMRWLGYGDSLLLVFGRDGDNVALTDCYPSTLEALGHDPHLLNWKQLPEETRLRTGTMDFHGRTTVILASDGVGQFVLLRYLADMYSRHAGSAPANPPEQARDLLNEFRRLVQTGDGRLAEAAKVHLENQGTGFADQLAALQTSLVSEEAFLGMMREYHQRGLLPNDDATLIMIEIDNRGVDGLDKEPLP